MTELELRRARIRQLREEGRIETDSMRKKRKQAAKYQSDLESTADTIICGLTRSSSRKIAITTPREKSVTPDANVSLKSSVKFDQLSVTANQILQELFQ